MTVAVKFDPNIPQVQAAIIQDATPLNDGVMTKEQAAKLANLSSTPLALIVIDVIAATITDQTIFPSTHKIDSCVFVTVNGHVQTFYEDFLVYPHYIKWISPDFNIAIGDVVQLSYTTN